MTPVTREKPTHSGWGDAINMTSRACQNPTTKLVAHDADRIMARMAYAKTCRNMHDTKPPWSRPRCT